MSKSQLYQPRPYQIRFLEAASAARAQGIKSGLLVMAGGLGKTISAIFDAEQYLDEHPNARFLYLCDQETILIQNRRKFHRYFGKERSYGLYTGNNKTLHRVDFLFATLQSVRDHSDDFPVDAYDYIMVDEAHHTSANTYEPVIRSFRPQFLLGLTATPDREDGRNILDTYHHTLFEMDIYQGWAEGYLTRAQYELMLDDIDERQLKEYLSPENAGTKVSLAQLNRTLFAPKRDEEIVASARARIAAAGIENPRIFAFCSNIAYAESMAQHFGDGAAVVHSGQSRALNEALLSDFRSGKLNTILAVDMLNEGVDVPEANVLIFLRATDAKRIFFQQLARGLRLSEGKDFTLVLDYVCNVERISEVLEMEESAKQRSESVPSSPSTPQPLPPITVNIPATQFRIQRVDIERILCKTLPWSCEEMIAALQAKAQELKRTPTAVEVDNEPTMPHSSTYCKCFGKWSNAIKAAGLDSIRPYAYNEKELISALKRKTAELGHSPRQRDILADQRMPSVSAYIRVFGSWEAALAKVSCQPKKTSKYSKEQLIKILQDKAKQLGRNPTTDEMQIPHYSTYVNAFGSWKGALIAAKLDLVGIDLSDEELLLSLQRKSQQLGRTPKRSEVNEDRTMPSASLYTKHFGSWQKAIEKAGLPTTRADRADYSDLTQERVIQMLQEKSQQLGRTPSKTDFDKDPKLPNGTVVARRFGGWNEALLAAGLTPNQIKARQK